MRGWCTKKAASSPSSSSTTSRTEGTSRRFTWSTHAMSAASHWWYMRRDSTSAEKCSSSVLQRETYHLPIVAALFGFKSTMLPSQKTSYSRCSNEGSLQTLTQMVEILFAKVVQLTSYFGGSFFFLQTRTTLN